MYSLLVCALISCLIPAEYGDQADVSDGSSEESRDHTVDYPAADIEIRSPDIEVLPFSEILLCYFGTYDGPTVGIVDFQPLHDATYTHHNRLNVLPSSDEFASFYDEFADGDWVNCDDVPFFDRLTPMVEAVGVEVSDENVNQDWLNLIDGDAIKLNGGVRYVMDLHFINPTPDTLLLNAGQNIGVVDESEVERWVGVVRFDVGHLEIPPNSTHTQTFSCDWPEDVEVLSMYGHMHDYGEEFSVYSSTDPDPVYSIEGWTPDYRWLPPVVNYGPGELTVTAGETYEVACTWNNTTDETLFFPTEMCNAAFVVAPLTRPMSCVDGEYVPEMK